MSEKIVRCECGQIAGERCAWEGPVGETVLVEWMPEYLRASHIAAGNSGRYPHNGAIGDLLGDDGWLTRVEAA